MGYGRSNYCRIRFGLRFWPLLVSYLYLLSKFRWREYRVLNSPWPFMTNIYRTKVRYDPLLNSGLFSRFRPAKLENSLNIRKLSRHMQQQGGWIRIKHHPTHPMRIASLPPFLLYEYSHEHSRSSSSIAGSISVNTRSNRIPSSPFSSSSTIHLSLDTTQSRIPSSPPALSSTIHLWVDTRSNLCSTIHLSVDTRSNRISSSPLSLS